MRLLPIELDFLKKKPVPNPLRILNVDGSYGHFVAITGLHFQSSAESYVPTYGDLRVLLKSKPYREMCQTQASNIDTDTPEHESFSGGSLVNTALENTLQPYPLWHAAVARPYFFLGMAASETKSMELFKCSGKARRVQQINISPCYP